MGSLVCRHQRAVCFSFTRKVIFPDCRVYKHAGTLANNISPASVVKPIHIQQKKNDGWA